jgi:tetratricopeptide (TPR) repeat protein
MLSTLFAISCAGDSDFQQQLTRLGQEKRGVELFNALLELDQKYADKIELKIKLGQMLLDSGDIDKASSYLKRGEGLINAVTDNRLKTELFYYLGILNYIQGKAAESLVYAEKALVATKDDSLSHFLKARSLYQMGDKEKSYELYKQYWPKDKGFMNKEDLNFYFAGAVEQKEYERAIEILDTYQLLYEYIIGQGVQASTFYEQLKNVNCALFAACMDLEYLRYLEAIDDKKLSATFTDLAVKIADKSLYPDRQSRDTLKAIEDFFQNNWAAAQKELKKISEKHAFLQYMLLVCELETEGASQDRLKAYVSIEQYFKGLPGYYYHFWRGMKKGQGEYSFSTAKAVLEKCILLASKTRFARETRQELGRLLGLTEKEGEKILLGAELDLIFNDLVAGKDITLLDPVLELISLPDNVYEMAAVLMLRQLQTRIPRVKTYLEQKKAKVSGRLGDRLVMVLEG